MDIHTLPTTPMNLKDWLTAAAMWTAGFVMISCFIAFLGIVARYAVFTFCIGYGC